MYFFEQTIYKKEPINTNIQEQQKQPVQKQTQKQPVQTQISDQQLEQQLAQQQQQQAQQVDPNQEQQQQYDPNQQNIEQQYDQAESSADVLNSPTSVSIKRYFLIKKMFALNEKLNRLNMENDVLNFLVNFIDSFSYEALLSITRKLVEEIYNNLQSPEQVKPKLETNLG
jgi:hypothetical protein